MDLDGTGQLRYNEFLRLLKRNGLKTVSEDEKILT